VDFLQKVLQGLSLVPAVVNSIEGLFGRRSGQQKKESAMAFVLAAMQLPAQNGNTGRSGDSVTEATAGREIADEARFKEGLSKVIDGAVECLNASCWARTGR
jgi:hypothetical protein